MFAFDHMGMKSAGLCVLVALAGCASQGPLQPPSLHLPQPAQGLTATRVGDEVELAWTTPARTTDGELIKGAITAKVCATAGAGLPVASKSKKRGRKPAASPTASAPETCKPVLRLVAAPAAPGASGSPGASKATVKLAAGQAAGAPALLAYQVELANATGRSAGWSVAAYAATGAAPEALGGLRLSAGRERVVVEWMPAGGEGTVELRRTLVAAAQTVPEKLGKKPVSALTVLRSDAASGGTVDESVRDGDTYVYVAQRVKVVTIDGRAIEIRGTASSPATIAYHDTIPPKAPTALVLIPGGGFGEKPSIDLSWDTNEEPDLLGYNVYRSDGAAFTRLNTEPVAVPSFRDMQVQAGQRYTYRVTAVDRRHNESPPSATVSESLRP